jgi:lipoteichoic acid synthase
VEPLTDFPSMMINDYAYPNSIISQLTKNSYSTIAFHGNVGSYFNRDVAYPKMGYQELADMTKMDLKDEGWGAPDSKVFNYTENQLKNEKQPFFAYSITMSSHGPFTNVNNYYNNPSYNDVKDTVARDYMNSMSYVDQSLSDYISYIRTNYKNTYIFIWGDHTPNVNSSDYRQASFTEGDKYFEFVPLVIVTPDKKQYKEDKIVASFLDIAPTIAKASGIPYNIDSNGLDLFNRKNSLSTIPFKGATFDRSYLFEKISQIMSANNNSKSEASGSS